MDEMLIESEAHLVSRKILTMLKRYDLSKPKDFIDAEDILVEIIKNKKIKNTEIK